MDAAYARHGRHASDRLSEVPHDVLGGRASESDTRFAVRRQAAPKAIKVASKGPQAYSLSRPSFEPELTDR